MKKIFIVFVSILVLLPASLFAQVKLDGDAPRLPEEPTWEMLHLVAPFYQKLTWNGDPKDAKKIGSELAKLDRQVSEPLAKTLSEKLYDREFGCTRVFPFGLTVKFHEESMNDNHSLQVGLDRTFDEPVVLVLVLGWNVDSFNDSLLGSTIEVYDTKGDLLFERGTWNVKTAIELSYRKNKNDTKEIKEKYDPAVATDPEARCGYKEIVEASADANVSSEQGKTALEYARINGNAKMVQALLKAGAKK